MSLRDDLTPVNERLAVIESQLARMVADMESEKGTRSRVNDKILERITKHDRMIWLGLGALMALQAAFGVYAIMRH